MSNWTYVAVIAATVLFAVADALLAGFVLAVGLF